MTKIYKATNTVNGKAYIGITNGKLGDRKKGHLRSESLFKVALEAFGPHNFSWEILEYHKHKKDAVRREVELIKEHKTQISENGYNVMIKENNGGCKVGRNLEAKFQELDSLLTLYNEGDF